MDSDISIPQYVPFLKTQEAELKSISNLSSEIKKNILPFLILTKSRYKGDKYHERHPEEEKHDIQISLKKWKEAFSHDLPFFLDITGEECFENSQIAMLFDSKNGFENWTSFLIEQKKSFPNLIPIIQIDTESDPDLVQLKKQIETLSKHFSHIGYKEEIYHEEDSAQDVISYLNDTYSKIKSCDKSKVYLILDAGYMNENKHFKLQEKASEIISYADKIETKAIILTGTSFPLSISEFFNDQTSDESEVQLKSETIALHKAIKSNLPNLKTTLIYGDYAWIHTTKASNTSMARGWIPRIDVSLGDHIFFLRQRRNGRSYQNTYRLVAHSIIQKPEFLSVVDCWGKDEICKAANGFPTQCIPRFWVSVRSNIHITTINQKLAQFLIEPPNPRYN